MLKEVFTKFKDLIINVIIIFVGIMVAVGVFAVLRNIDQQKERETLLPRARDAVTAQEYSQAINLYLKADKEFPDNVEVKRSLGDLYFLKGKYDEALTFYESIPQNARIKEDDQKIGEIYYIRKDFDKVIAAWNGKEIEPRDTYKLASIYYDRDNFDAYFSELAKLQQYKEPVLLSQIRTENLASVISNTDKALTLPSISTEPLNTDQFKTLINEAKKQLDLGKKDYSDLIQISAYSNLNQCKLLTERISMIRKTFDSKKIPTFQVDYYQGYCLNQLNKPDEALPLLQNAIKNDPTIIEYREALARTYFLKEDADNLKKVYNDIITIQKSPTYYQNLAALLYRLDLKDDALAQYENAFGLVQNAGEKEKIALTMLQINLRDKSNLEACSKSDLLDLMQYDSYEEMLILGHCNIYLKKNLDIPTDAASLASQYLVALNKKDRKEVDKALDKDPDGLITIYFKAVGAKLLK
jgi:tetratricopeptide (TPR) repeat protein